MASTTATLILNATANSSGIKQVTADLQKQQQQLKQLASAEKARSAAARASLAQQKSLAAQEQANSAKTVASQQKAAQAMEAAKAATARADIAAKQHALSLAKSAAEADKAGSAVSKIGSLASSAGSIAASSFQTLVGVLGSIVATAGKAGLALAAIGTAGLAAGLKNAMDAESQTILAKGNIASALGGNRVAAGKFLNQQNAAITAGSGGLIDPGISRSFANIFADDIVKAFGADAVSAQLSAGMANQLSALVTLGGAEKGQLSNVIGDFVNGALTEGQLQQRDVLGSSGLLKPLKDELEKTGKSIKDLNPGERIKVLDAALKRALTSDTLQELANTAKGQISVLKNRLFGENGLFSVTRDILPNVEGKQTVFEQFKNSLKLLFNSDGLFAQLGRIMSNSGINLDLMATIRNGWEKLNSWLQGLNQWLQGIGTVDEFLSKVGGFTGLGQMLADKVNEGIQSIDAKKIGEAIGNVLNGIGGFLKELDWGLIAQKLGQGLASFFGTLRWDNMTAVVVAAASPKLASMLTAWLLSATGKSLAAAGAAASAKTGQIAGGVTAGQAAGAAAGASGLAGGALSLAVLAQELDKILKAKGSQSSGTGIVGGGLKLGTGNQIGGLMDLSKAISPEDQQKILNMFTAPLQQAAKLGTSIHNGLAQVVTAVGNGINQMKNSATQFGTQLATSAATKWSEISTQISTKWGEVSTGVSMKLGEILQWTQTKWTEISTWVSTKWGELSTTVSTKLGEIIMWTQNKWTEISTWVSTKWNEVYTAVSDAVSQIVSKAQEAFNSAVEAASGLSSLAGIVSSFVSSLTSKVQEATSSALSGFQSSVNSAAQNVLNQVKSGANPTSFTPTAYSSSSGASSNLSIGALNIYQQPGESAEQLADKVIVALDSKLRQRMIALTT